MEFRKIFKMCMISALSLLVLGGANYSATNTGINAKHVKHTRYYHNPWHYYHIISRLATVQYKHPSHHHRVLVNQAFNKYNRRLSGSQLIQLQKHYGVYRLLYHNTKKYYYNILSNAVNTEDTQKYANTRHLSKYSKQDSRFDDQIRTDFIKDINKTRRHYALKPLKVTTMLQRTANYRNPKVLFAYEHPLDCLKYEHLSMHQLNQLGGTTDGWIHGIDTHTTGDDFLTRHHCHPIYWSAMANEWYINKHCKNDDGSIVHLPSTTPHNIAYDINDYFINHDMAHENDNGHRKTELSPHLHYMGVGVNYDRARKLGSINIQFAK